MKKVKIVLGETASDSKVLVDGEMLDGVRKVKVDAQVHEATKATIELIPEHVEADVDIDELTVEQSE